MPLYQQITCRTLYYTTRKYKQGVMELQLLPLINVTLITRLGFHYRHILLHNITSQCITLKSHNLQFSNQQQIIQQTEFYHHLSQKRHYKPEDSTLPLAFTLVSYKKVIYFVSECLISGKKLTCSFSRPKRFLSSHILLLLLSNNVTNSSSVSLAILLNIPSQESLKKIKIHNLPRTHSF